MRWLHIGRVNGIASGRIMVEKGVVLLASLAGCLLLRVCAAAAAVKWVAGVDTMNLY